VSNVRSVGDDAFADEPELFSGSQTAAAAAAAADPAPPVAARPRRGRRLPTVGGGRRRRRRRRTATRQATDERVHGLVTWSAAEDGAGQPEDAQLGDLEATGADWKLLTDDDSGRSSTRRSDFERFT